MTNGEMFLRVQQKHGVRGGGKQINLLTLSLAGTPLFVTEDTASKGLT